MEKNSVIFWAQTNTLTGLTVTENPRETTDKLLKLIRESRKVAGYKTNTYTHTNAQTHQIIRK